MDVEFIPQVICTCIGEITKVKSICWSLFEFLWMNHFLFAILTSLDCAVVPDGLIALPFGVSSTAFTDNKDNRTG